MTSGMLKPRLRHGVSKMKIGDRVHIHYVDIDGICGAGNIICEGTVIRGLMNGTIRVQFKDENSGYFETEREFYPRDLLPILEEVI